MERGPTLPPLSSPHAAPSLPRGLVPLLTGSSVDECRSKHFRAKGGLPSNLSRQVPPTLVTPDHKRWRDPFICADGEEMGPTPLPDAQ
jgi:hypothetical protein